MNLKNVLTITGSDGTGGAGIQADVTTISAMGGNALSAITSISIAESDGYLDILDAPAEIVVRQVKSLVERFHPLAIKIGLVRNRETISNLRNEVVGCPNIVCDPGIRSVKGIHLMDEDSVDAYVKYFFPEAKLVMLRCDELESIFGQNITSEEDMLEAAKRVCGMGAQWVLLRGGKLSDDRLSALLYGEGEAQFFSSYNVEGWLKHGVSSAMSSAIASRLAFGDDVKTAVNIAHDYLHNQVYALSQENNNTRIADLYDKFLNFIVKYHSQAHDVSFYAEKLTISTRYLSTVTHAVIGQTPKEVIDAYLMKEACVLLSTTRLSIQEISIRLGYPSQALFCRHFKALKGTTPSNYKSGIL